MVRDITIVSWFVKNKDIYGDLNMPTINQTIAHFDESYAKCIEVHSNPLAINLLEVKTRRILRQEG